MITKIIIGIVLYFGLFPGLLKLVSTIKQENAMKMYGRNALSREDYEPLFNEVMKYVRFGLVGCKKEFNEALEHFEDKELYESGETDEFDEYIPTIVHKQPLLKGVALVGLIATVVTMAMSKYVISVLIALLVPIYVATLCRKFSYEVLDGREEVMENIRDIKTGTIGIVDNKRIPEISIDIWDIDLVTPKQVTMSLPTAQTYDADEQGRLYRQFTNAFGEDYSRSPHSWINAPNGWDIRNKKVTIVWQPALPVIAPFSEHYILNEKIAWSYFPLAIGEINGVPIYNENRQVTKYDSEQDKLVTITKPGEELVLGFDFVGKQDKVCPGTSPIPKCPHLLIAGSTGGGKALAFGEKLRLFNSDDTVDIKNVKVGDRLQGTDPNKPAVVDYVFDSLIPERMYEIEMEDGRTVKCSGNHLWYIETNKYDKEYIRNKIIKYFEDKDDMYFRLKHYEHYSTDDIESAIKEFSTKDEDRFAVERLILQVGYTYEESGEKYYSSFDIKNYMLYVKSLIKEDKEIPYGITVTTDEMVELDKLYEINIPENSDRYKKIAV